MNRFQRIKWILLDACLAALALSLAYLQRFLPLQIGLMVEPAWREYFSQALFIVPVFVMVRVLLFVYFDLYRGVSRFAGAHELYQVILSVSAGTLALLLWSLGVRSMETTRYVFGDIPTSVPLGVVAMDWLTCLVLIGGARMAVRMWRLTRFNSAAAIHNVLIVGAGDVGELVARNFLHNPQMGFRPVGYIDEDPVLQGRQIHGLPVFSSLDELPDLIEGNNIVEVLVATRKPSLPFLNRIVEICETRHVGFKIVPAVSDVMQERVSINQIRPVEIEDLLGREPVDLALDEDMNYLKDEVVLVTGAGGSIGSELCRQILRNDPHLLIILGRGENSLFEIALELGRGSDKEKIALEIADIQDVDRLEKIYERYHPTIVFHAAAHKHVPLMELHPQEAVKNNVIGTFNVAFLAKRFGVKRFTFISTDKAVHPTSVMGATKRVAEMSVSALSRDSEETVFLSVRFGNVLGSRGSVVPIFRRQIADGGPVTVMHPEIERYFMTIPEATNLVLQAGAIGDNGQLFLLDMGQPVNIADLARRMITLSGYEPNVDVDIEFVGLRPGEKLKEELLTDNENLAPTVHHKIFSTRVHIPDLEEVKEWLRRFNEIIYNGTPPEVVDLLREIVPEYTPDLAARPDKRQESERNG